LDVKALLGAESYELLVIDKQNNFASLRDSRQWGELLATH